MYNPVSSYRIQFNSSFTFASLERQIDYLNMLGTVTIYASPVFEATPGSNHGYDVTDPGRINPELGTIDDLTRLKKLLQERDMGWIQDIVPNHMAYSPLSKWIWDILEKGTDSEFFSAFDTEPDVSRGTGKIMLPFLGNDPEWVIENFELQVIFHKGSLALRYYDNIFPASFDSFREFFVHHTDEAPDCFRLLWQRYDLGYRVADRAFLNGDWEVIKKEIESFCEPDPAMHAYMAGHLGAINGNAQLLREFVHSQHYEPCHWRDTAHRINYRRFFTVNGLICLRMEDRQVMEKHHEFLYRLVGGGYFRGLRVDHIDGLRDPAGYLNELRARAGEDAYIIVEKILEPGEKMPVTWPVAGNSGYDFLAAVNNLLLQERGYKRLQKFYHQLTGDNTSAADIIYRNKKMILTSHMNGEWENVFSLFCRFFSYAERKGLAAMNENRKINHETLRQAIGEFMVALPVYRLYPDKFPLPQEDRDEVTAVIASAVKREPSLKGALNLVRDLLVKEMSHDRLYYTLLEDVFRRLMQYTGPLTAKGVEDTSMYQYSSFIAGNEVGDSLYARGIGTGRFHEAMAERQQSARYSMSTTSTHDTKRGEDARARLNALGVLADEWAGLVKEWVQANKELKRENAPSVSEEYFIYQTLAGTFPFDEDGGSEYTGRIREYLLKALREAKQSTSWEEPDEKYENAVGDFAQALLSPGSRFMKTFIPFHRKLAPRGVVNSLVQLTLKCCLPGMPDIYRGTEVWDLTLVDPDNRRPVDFDALHESLKKISGQWQKEPAETIASLFRNPGDGRVKHLLTSIMLNERKADPGLFLMGDYIPLTTGGQYGNNIFAFIRKHGESWLMCIVPLHSGYLSYKEGIDHFAAIKWKDTHIALPEGAPGRWTDILSGRPVEANGQLAASELFGEFPVALLKGRLESSQRKAGILMHVTSLPGKYGSGDFGEEAFRFVDLLSKTCQSYWQTLPLSPVTKTQSWSPYSSPSAFAGSTLLVSPQQLYTDSLIDSTSLGEMKFPARGKVNHEQAGAFREVLLNRAWDKFRKNTGHFLYQEYKKFCNRESHWLDDYALFLAYKHQFGQKEWSRWPRPEKTRDLKTIKTARYEFADFIRREKFKQYMFDRQWKKVKGYANSKGISIFGDIPYYVSYDSADVWSHQRLFNLRDNGKMKTVAGVPPDYFDKNGQLWNMPVYNWDVMKESGYDWWLRRIRRNLELFDLLRLDHFRAFSAYWEVPAGEKTAVRGEWRKGPGQDFFSALQQKFPSMPFVAEDLGDIDQDVYDLKDQFGLPGMQVLQFSFDKEMASNIHTPHNHAVNSLVYTGTHDNNTLRGWYDNEFDREGKKRLHEYVGKKIRVADVNRELIRMAFASPARIAVIPMQDYLGLGREARMNTPSTSKGNWLWKIASPTYDQTTEDTIRKLTVMYRRE